VTESFYDPERRPIASRERALSKRTASWLASRGTAPNDISLAGMAAGIAAGVALACTSLPGVDRLCFLAAALLIQFRLLCNMFDGMVAVQTGKASPVGELYNEVPDRVSDAAILIGAGYASGSLPELGYLAACVALFVAYVRAQGKAAGAPQEFCGPMAKQQRMFVLTVLSLYCALTPISWQPRLSVAINANPPHSYGLMSAGLLVIIVGGVWTAIRRLLRIAQSLRRGQP
jgi:phosphatidylglycerophosphate synthase